MCVAAQQIGQGRSDTAGQQAGPGPEKRGRREDDGVPQVDISLGGRHGNAQGHRGGSSKGHGKGVRRQAAYIEGHIRILKGDNNCLQGDCRTHKYSKIRL